MIVNVPYRTRAALYVFTLLGSPVIAYLQVKGIIGALEVTLWLAEVSAVSALAAFNVQPSKEEKL